MAGLDQALRLQAALNKRPDSVDQEDLAKLLATQSALGRITERLAKPHVTPEELSDAVASISAAVGDVSKQIQSLAGDVAERPTTFDPVLSAVRDLSRKLEQLIGAMGRIEIPTPVIPPFPAIPEIAPVDLTPVLASNESIKAMIASMVSAERDEEAEPEKPREWVFDVKRNNSGLIRTVEVREV